VAEQRDRPHANSNFVVEFGSGASRSGRTGFAEVVFPSFHLEHDADVTHAPAPPPRLVLRRGADGSLDLYRWWDQARRGKAPKRRTLRVRLLADDHETVVLTWTFRNVVPRALSYSPLNANEGAVLMETIELAYDSVEMG